MSTFKGVCIMHLKHSSLIKAALSLTLVLAATATLGQQAPVKLTLFGLASVNNDSVWMAIDKGYYKDEGIDLTYRLFPSGTTAFQTFQTGQGDIVLSGDLPSLQYFARAGGNYRTIASMERDAKGYVAVSSKAITKPQDLVGKTIATRVGSTGSWFVAEYLARNGVDAAKVVVKNLDTQVMAAAVCGGDISAFFVWQPTGSRAIETCPDKVHYLSDATGYIQGYLVAGARAQWLATPEGRDIATRWLRATIKGRDVAKADFAAVAAYAAKNFGLSESATREQWTIMDRNMGFDKDYYRDFCSLSRWGRADKALEQTIDFGKILWPDGLRSIDPKLVEAAPPPC